MVLLSFKFTLTFTSAFLGGHNLGPFYAGHGINPDLNLSINAKVATGSCPGVRLEVKMYNRSD